MLELKVKNEFESNEFFTVQLMGWVGKTNGELLLLASNTGFQVFVTIDKRLKYQLNTKNYNLAIIVLDVPLNRLEYLRPLIPILVRRLPGMKAGEVYEIK